MEFRKHLMLLALALFALLALNGRSVDACACMPSHPQTHYCTADYVVQLRVLRKSETMGVGKTLYKVHIKRIYKASPAAKIMLRDGRLSTPGIESDCAVKLDIGRVYIIAGRLPQLNFCAYYKEYTKMTITERRGFSGGYAKTCNCTVQPCFGNKCLDKSQYADTCKWSPWGVCERDYSACMPHFVHTENGRISSCRWRRSKLYRECLSNP